MLGHKGFTIIEVLIVVLILGTLVAVAMPAFHGMPEKAIDTEAYVMFNAISNGQQQYYLEYEEYLDAMDIPPVSEELNKRWNALGLENPNANDKAKFWYRTFGVSSPTVETHFGIWASRKCNDPVLRNNHGVQYFIRYSSDTNEYVKEYTDDYGK